MDNHKIESIDLFIENNKISEKISDVDFYSMYKEQTKEPVSKTMFTQYLKNEKGIIQKRKMKYGKRYYFYSK